MMERPESASSVPAIRASAESSSLEPSRKRAMRTLERRSSRAAGAPLDACPCRYACQLPGPFKDHGDVTKLFQRFANGRGDRARAAVVEKICDELARTVSPLARRTAATAGRP